MGTISSIPQKESSAGVFWMTRMFSWIRSICNRKLVIMYWEDIVCVYRFVYIYYICHVWISMCTYSNMTGIVHWLTTLQPGILVANGLEWFGTGRCWGMVSAIPRGSGKNSAIWRRARTVHHGDGRFRCRNFHWTFSAFYWTDLRRFKQRLSCFCIPAGECPCEICQLCCTNGYGEMMLNASKCARDRGSTIEETRSLRSPRSPLWGSLMFFDVLCICLQHENWNIYIYIHIILILWEVGCKMMQTWMQNDANLDAKWCKILGTSCCRTWDLESVPRWGLHRTSFESIDNDESLGRSLSAKWWNWM